jgi:cell division protein FtsL
MKRIVLALTAALILAAMMVVAAPAMAQQTKQETTMKKSKVDDKGKEGEKKDLPQSGGASS